MGRLLAFNYFNVEGKAICSNKIELPQFIEMFPSILYDIDKLYYKEMNPRNESQIYKTGHYDMNQWVFSWKELLH